MSTQTTSSTSLGGLPRVNLLPPEIAEAQRFRQVQAAMGGAVILAVVAVAGLYVHEKSGVTDAQSQLTAAQQQQTTAQQKLTSLTSVKSTYADVASKQAELSSAMGQEIRWSGLLNDLTQRVPSNVWLTGINATETTVGTTTTSAPVTPLAGSTDSVGNISVSGVAMNHDDVASWLDALGREHGFSSPSFSSSNEVLIGSRKVVDFATFANLTSKILSNRYTTKAS